MKPKKLFDTTPKNEKAILIGLDLNNQNQYLSMDDSLAELELLAQTAGLKVIAVDKQKLDAPNPATFIGKGKVD